MLLCFFHSYGLVCFPFSRRLLTELDSFKPVLETKGKAKEAAGHDAKDHVLYELYHRPEHAQFSKNAKVSFSIATRVCLLLIRG